MAPGPRDAPEAVDPQAHYELAVQALDLDRSEDAAAARRLVDLLAQAPQVIDPTSLRPRFKGRPCIVLAPGLGGIDQVRSQPPGTPLIVAGSAVDRAYRHELHPSLVVTDLDGDASAHRGFSRRGVPMAVHAHGDNVDLLEGLVPELRGPVFATCQVEPPPAAAVDVGQGGAQEGEPHGPAEVRLHRVGGFTDGDRSCFLAAWLGASEVRLAGWDLDDEGASETKRAKLEVADRLLDEVPVAVRWLGDPRPPESTKGNG